MKSSPARQAVNDIDKSDMLSLLRNFPEQCRDALNIGQSVEIAFSDKDFKGIVFAGVGGSAIGSGLVRSYLYSECKLPIQVLEEYKLPDYVGQSSLVFISSYSGDTEETLSAYQDARRRKAKIVVFSSGGTLRELAEKDKAVFIKMPGGLAPRCALGYLSIIPLCVLAKLGLIREAVRPVQETVRVLRILRERKFDEGSPENRNIARAIAARLFNKFIIIYSSSLHFDVCAKRFRGQLAENAKTLSSTHYFPDMAHNEIVGWQSPKKLLKDFSVVMFRDKALHSRISKSMDITEDILKKEGVDVIEIFSEGKGLLSRIFSLIYIGDFISYYLALLYGVDPTPIDRVTYLKKELAKT